MRLNLEFTKGTLDTDIKSLKKAARQGICDELINRAKEIIDKKDLRLESNYKIYWKDNPIGKVKKGKDYLSPEIEVIADEALEITPESCRLRKAILDPHERKRSEKSGAAA